MYPPPPPPPTNNIGDRVHVPLAVTVKGPLVDAKNISEYDDPSPAPITLQEPLQQQKDTSTTASSWIRPSLSKPWFPPPPQPPLAYTTSVRVHEPQEQQQVLTSHPVTQVVHEIEPRPALYSSSSAAAATAAAVATVPCLPPAPMPMHHLYTPMGRSLNSGMKPPPYMYTATAARPATTTIAPPPIMQYSTMAAKHTFPPPPPPPTTTHSTIPTLTSLYSVPPIAPPSSLTAASSQSPHQDRHHQHHPHSVPHVPLFTRTIHSYPDLYCNTIPVYFPRKALEMWKMNHMNNKTHVSSSTSYSSSPVSTHILHPPPEDSRYLVQDDGNASPRVLTCNMMIIPQNSYLLQKTMGGTTCSTTSSHGDTKTHVFGLICQPLAIPSMDFITHDYSITSKTINHDSITKVEIHNEMESNVHNIRHENNKGEKQDDTVDDDWELLPDLEKVPLISTWYNSTFHRSTTTTPHLPTLKSLQPVTPLRCTFCQAYVNPFCTVSYSTHKETCTITCPFCSTQTTVSLDTYLVSTSSTYDLQQQQQQQPILPQLDSVVSSITHTTALQFGTVEYEVGGPYITRHVDSFSSSSYEVVPNMDSIAPPLVYLYAIDISFCSYPSTRTDMYTHLLQGYLDALRFVAQEMAICWCKQQQDVLTLGLPPRVGFILYDDQGQVIIPYWTLNKIRSTGASEWKVQVALMCDVCKDPFAPLPLSEWTYYTMDCQQSCTPVEKDNNDKKKHSILFNNSMNGYKEMLQQIPTILKQLSPKLGEGKTTSSNMNFTGSALSVLVHALESNTMDSSGGRITILTSSRPNTGVGALSDLETSSTSDRGIVGGSSTTTIKYSRMETERILYTSLLKLVEGKIPFTKTPMDDQAYSFYSQLIRVCQKSNTSIDICMTTPRVMGRNFLGLATLGDVCQRTCGALKWLSYIDTADIQGSWKHQLQSELLRSALVYSGNDAVFKLRCSNGLHVKKFLPNNNLRVGSVVDTSELEFTRINADTCIAIELDYDIGGIPKSGIGKANSIAYFQSALLYTTMTGHRRLRVSTLALPTSSSESEVFKAVRFGATCTLLIRKAIDDLYDPSGCGNLKRSGSLIMDHCVNMLANYRHFTEAKHSTWDTFVLPDTLGLLPLFCLGLRKSLMFRSSLSKDATQSSLPSPNGDERAYKLFFGSRITPVMSMLCVHPNLFSILDMKTGDGEWIPSHPKLVVDDRSKISCHIALSEPIPSSVTQLQDNGIYLLDDGLTIYLFIGRDVNIETREDLLFYDHTEPRLQSSSTLAKKIIRIIHQIRRFTSIGGVQEQSIRPIFSPLILVIGTGGSGYRKGIDDASEKLMIESCIDDTSGGESSYHDFLYEVHRRVKEKQKTLT